MFCQPAGFAHAWKREKKQGCRKHFNCGRPALEKFSFTLVEIVSKPCMSGQEIERERAGQELDKSTGEQLQQMIGERVGKNQDLSLPQNVAVA